MRYLAEEVYPFEYTTGRLLLCQLPRDNGRNGTMRLVSERKRRINEGEGRGGEPSEFRERNDTVTGLTFRARTKREADGLHTYLPTYLGECIAAKGCGA